MILGLRSKVNIKAPLCQVTTAMRCRMKELMSSIQKRKIYGSEVRGKVRRWSILQLHTQLLVLRPCYIF